MALTLEQKKAVVSEVSGVASQALAAVAAEYRGLTVEQMTNLRVLARKENVYVRVVKNTLAKRAFEGTDFECMGEGLVGPLVLAFSQDDPGAAGRVIKDFAKTLKSFDVKMVAVGGKVYDGSELDRLAKLPTLDQARAMLMGTMMAPIEKFVRTLNEPHAKLVRTVAAVRDQKQAA